MKNTVILSLTSDSDGAVKANLCSLFEFKIVTNQVEDINNALRLRGIRKFAFLGAKSGIECSFPLTLGDMFAAASLTEDAEQVIFIAGLNGEYPAIHRT